MTAPLKRVLLVAMSLACLALAQMPAAARDIVSTSFTTPNVDLTQVIEQVQSKEPSITVEMTPDASGSVATMTATTRREGEGFNWGVFTVRNQDPEPRDLVLTTRHWGFIGSQLFWPTFRSFQMQALSASPGLQPIQLQSTNMDAFQFRINPGETITYVVEWTNAPPDNVTLWHRSAYDANLQQTATFYGVLLGFALLLIITIICLFVIRPQIVFPAGLLFVAASLAFLFGEFGYLRGIEGRDIASDMALKVRAVSEALMGAGLIGCLITFLDLRTRAPIAWQSGIVAFSAACLVALWAILDPLRAAAVARVMFVVAAIACLGIAVTIAFSGAIRARASLLFFASVVVWTVIAIAGAYELINPGLLKLAVSCGLILVMAIATLTLMRFAFSQGVIHSKFFEDSGRRALALAGAEQSVWDWNEDSGTLHVGPELERALGVPPGQLIKGGLKAWMALIHPADRVSYIAGVEAAIRRGKGRFAEQFRLRRGDGTYRWYELRARAIAGDKEHAARCIGTLSDITTDKRAEDRLLADAVHDNITKLPNRALFLDRLERAMNRATNNTAEQLVVMVVDLDRFKNVNDGVGHTMGDSLLLAMARRLAPFAMAEETLARIAGDQFGLILNVADPARDPIAIANQIREVIAQPIEIKSREVFLTASIGLVEFGRNTKEAAEVLKDAEIALYEAKRTGKNTVMAFNPAMRDNRSELVSLETDMRRALERDEFEVLFQPITRLSNQELAGFEALVRWRHKERGLLSPDDFLGMAEETGLITQIGIYVLNESARQLGIWQRAFRPQTPLFVSVNLSHSQLLGAGLVDEVKAALAREDLPPATLKIEVTESIVMENPELSMQVLGRLRRVGVGLSCDDFGTGYSSLSMLQRLPFDTLKIDKFFVETEQDSDASARILEMIVALAHELNLSVVVEGIENAEQVERMRQLGCDFAQGFHFGEPMTSKRVIDTLGGSGSAALEAAQPSSGIFSKVFGKEVDEGDRQIAQALPETAPTLPPPPQSTPEHAQPHGMDPSDAPLEYPDPLQQAEIDETVTEPETTPEPEQVAEHDEPAISPETAPLPPPIVAPPAPSVPPPSTVQASPVSPLPPPAVPRPAPNLIDESAGDDLTQIVGVGSAVNRVLGEMGFTSFDDIADLSEEDAERINARIGFPGRVQRELWVEQADDLRNGNPAWTRDQQEARIRSMAVEEDAEEEVHEDEVEDDAPVSDSAASGDGQIEAEPEAESAAAEEGDEEHEEHVVDQPDDDGSEGAEPAEETASSDDLTKIKGIGKKLSKLLNEHDIHRFAQLAALSDEDVSELDKKLKFPGRIDREKWREQARDLMNG